MKKHKILFANVPADGHFNPLSGIAAHLKQKGHDVRWYSGKLFEDKIFGLGIPVIPFDKAIEVNQFNVDEIFPERKNKKPGISQLNFDLKHIFIERAGEYYEDLCEIKKSFDFDVLVADCTFIAGTFLKEKLKVPFVAVGVVPLMATSKDLPPYGMGREPDYSHFGKKYQKFLRFISKNFVFRDSTEELNRLANKLGCSPYKEIIFDIPVITSDIFLQSGVPGFDYERTDWPDNVKFVGPLHTFSARKFTSDKVLEEKMKNFSDKVLITQGTVETDPEKLIIPSLEALKESGKLLIVATGGHNTAFLQDKYPQKNIVIRDYVDYNTFMPECDVYITNGGYGGILIAIQHELPIIAAGVNEGKNELCNRIAYAGIGINLKTERPEPEIIAKAVSDVLNSGDYKNKVCKLKEEFASYNPMLLCEEYILSVIHS